jgi:hypothetical protein
MPERAKKKTAVKASAAKRRGRKPKAAKKAATSKPAPKPAKPKKRGRKNAMPKVRERRRIIGRLYFVRKWPPRNILTHINGAGHNITMSTLHKDIEAIRKEFQEAKKNGEGNLDSIVHEITLGKDERVQILWNELTKLMESDAEAQKRRELLNAKLDDPEANSALETIIKGIAECERIISSNYPKKQMYLKELREHDATFVECLRKLGVTEGAGDNDDDDDVLKAIRERRKKLDVQVSVTVNDGGGDGDSSDRPSK